MTPYLPSIMGKPFKEKEGMEQGGPKELCSPGSTDAVPTSQAYTGQPPEMELQDIVASRKELEVKIDTIATDLGILRDDHRKLTDRVSSTERTL
ncbi:hypothetical protein NDU88_003243 [Pleurodeles waltl]|uniref:Uncharacterized protein n=1 Tax=Pleurodeles waltl TaxID=8319 RepID=A0AAV7LER5_PLEWA|nr:hypothetical protein NDU88_003243 [Pleurodeles waltl]